MVRVTTNWGTRPVKYFYVTIMFVWVDDISWVVDATNLLTCLIWAIKTRFRHRFLTAISRLNKDVVICSDELFANSTNFYMISKELKFSFKINKCIFRAKIKRFFNEIVFCNYISYRFILDIINHVVLLVYKVNYIFE